ncbi:MAG: NF038130 family PEP-CTERM protein [Cyanobacteriota bacterium]|nr:NF038130 family PEP-CTERM protein [Cyanobacteriota bacterium]
MAGIFNKFAIATSVASMTALVGTPALAASLAGPTVNGQHLTYDSDGTTTFLVDNNAANWGAALSGDGNIELAGQGGTPNAVGFGEFDSFDVIMGGSGYVNQSATTLTGTLDGTKYTFSSLTYDDWYGGPIDGYSNFAEKWMTEAWNDTSTGVQNSFASNGAADVDAALLGIAATDYSFFRRFSDPNIAYVNNDGGSFNFGLAAHLNHGSGLKLSEVVKVTIGEGDDAVTELFYGLGQADASGVYEEGDGVSHSGLYNFNIVEGGGVLSEDVPEPSTLLGLMAIGGLVAATKRKSQK